jgi:hypothetical protein
VSERLWTDRDQSLPAQARLVAKQFRCHLHRMEPASFAEPHASLRCVRELSDLGSFPAYGDSSVSFRTVPNKFDLNEKEFRFLRFIPYFEKVV